VKATFNNPRELLGGASYQEGRRGCGKKSWGIKLPKVPVLVPAVLHD